MVVPPPIAAIIHVTEQGQRAPERYPRTTMLAQAPASCHLQQGHRRAGHSSRLKGWWPMCGGLSGVVAMLKAEAEWQQYHLVKCVDRKNEVV